MPKVRAEYSREEVQAIMLAHHCRECGDASEGYFWECDVTSLFRDVSIELKPVGITEAEVTEP